MSDIVWHSVLSTNLPQASDLGSNQVWLYRDRLKKRKYTISESQLEDPSLELIAAGSDVSLLYGWAVSLLINNNDPFKGP